MRSPVAIVVAMLGVVVLALYPFIVEEAFAHLGVRLGGLLLLGVSVVWTVLRRQWVCGVMDLGALPLAAFFAAGILAVAFEDRRFMLIVPAGIYLAILFFFARSLQGPGSIIEQLARTVEPRAPDFIRPYCRKATVAWCVVFFGNAATLVILGFTDHDAWKAFATGGMWLTMGVFAVLEFLFRKWWFRYYFYNGPFDRFWSTLFPAENTPMGRRSMQYIEEVRAELRQSEDNRG